MKFSGRGGKEDAAKGPPTNIEGVEGPQKPKTGIPELDENPKLLKLMYDTLQRACIEIGQTGEQNPLAVIETPDGQFVQGFKNERLEVSHDEARRALLAAPADAMQYALAWAGYLTVEGVRYETVLVGGGERGLARGVTIGQRYHQKLPGVMFQAIGNLAILGTGENLLTMSSDPDAVLKLRPVFNKITADVDHNHSPGHEKPLTYEIRPSSQLILELGDLDLPYSKELKKKPDMVHVVIRGRIWATGFQPEAKEVYLTPSTLVPLEGGTPFPGFAEDGLIMIGWMPPVPPSGGSKTLGMPVFWVTQFRVKNKDNEDAKTAE
jgi:hypothetical protein